MKDLSQKIGTAYFDLNLRLTVEQLDEVVRQELMAQINAPQGLPDSVRDAMIEVLMWYLPNDTDSLPQDAEPPTEDYRRYVQ